MSRKVINILFIIGLCLYIPGIVTIIWGYAIFFQETIQNANTGTHSLNGFGSFITLVLIGAMMLGFGNIALLVARIGALMELGKAQDWVWFILMIIFGWIVLLIYLIAVPQPKPAPQYGVYPAYPPAPGQPWSGYPPQEIPDGTMSPPAQPWRNDPPPAEQPNISDKPQGQE